MGYVDFLLRLFSNFTIFMMLFLFFAGLFLSLERLFFLHRSRLRAESLTAGVINLLEKKRLTEALAICEQTPGSLARVLKRMLFLRDRPKDLIEAEYGLQIQWETNLMERRFGSIAMITKILPSLGFLGTISAIARGLWKVNNFGPYSSVDCFYGDVVTALAISTFAIGSNIFFNLFYHFLFGRLKSSVQDLESSSRQLFCHLISTK